MAGIKRQENLIGFCGAYCGECGMYRGRIYARIAKDFLEILKASDYADWLPNVMKLDFSFEDLLKGLGYFSKKDAGCYCQEPCKEGGGAPCKIRPCAKERRIDICYECEDFPCEHLSWILEKYPDRLEDYERFRKLGLEEWARFHMERGAKGYASATGKYYAGSSDK